MFNHLWCWTAAVHHFYLQDSHMRTRWILFQVYPSPSVITFIWSSEMQRCWKCWWNDVENNVKSSKKYKYSVSDFSIWIFAIINACGDGQVGYLWQETILHHVLCVFAALRPSSWGRIKLLCVEMQVIKHFLLVYICVFISLQDTPGSGDTGGSGVWSHVLQRVRASLWVCVGGMKGFFWGGFGGAQVPNQTGNTWTRAEPPSNSSSIVAAKRRNVIQPEIQGGGGVDGEGG